MDLKQRAKDIIKKLPKFFLVRNIIRNITGHYYSPLPSFNEIESRQQEIFSKKDLLGIDLQFEQQMEKLRQFSDMRKDIPFYSKEKRMRYNIDNPSFTYDDAPVLHYMMRMLSPARIIEIGSGNSSACMLDTSDLYLDGKVQFFLLTSFSGI